MDKGISGSCHKRSCFYCGLVPNLNIQGSAKSEHASWQTPAMILPEQLDRAASLPDLTGAARKKSCS